MTVSLYDLFFASIPLYLTLYTTFYYEQDLKAELDKINQNSPIPQIEEYDFIVAGGIVSTHLASRFSVLVLEAGGLAPPQASLPSVHGFLNKNSNLTYTWYSEPQLNASLNNQGRVLLKQGKSIGGGSSMNTMNFNRGNRKDYDTWAEMIGDDSWNYANLLEYFKKTENFGDLAIGNDELGDSGPIPIVSSVTVQTPIELEWSQVWRDAGLELGYQYLENAAIQHEGFGPTWMNTDNGRRSGTYAKFMKPLLDSNSQNLVVSPYSIVEKISFDESNRRATGVFYKKHGINRYAKARKEVIISAGSMSSPVILMKSGIGPRSDLEAVGINVIADLPVGQNSQDHIFVPIHGIQMPQDPYENLTETQIDEYLINGKGPFANNFEFAQAFISSESAKPDNWPNLHLYFFFNSKIAGHDNTLSLYTNFNRPKARGVIKLNDQHEMIWNPNALTIDEDFQALFEGVKFAFKILESEAFIKYGFTYPKIPISECSDFNFGTDDYIKCVIGQTSTSAWHPAASCRMGKIDDPLAVTDTKLKVIGFENLRVVDASIMPSVPNGNTNCPSFMIGQKGADLILQDHKYYDRSYI